MFVLQADTIFGLLWTLFVCILTKSRHCPWGEQANKSYLGNYYDSSLRDRTETGELRHSRPGHATSRRRWRAWPRPSDATEYLFRMRGMHTVQGVPKNLCPLYKKKIEDIFWRSQKISNQLFLFSFKIEPKLNWASHKSIANLKLVFSVYVGLKKINSNIDLS